MYERLDRSEGRHIGIRVSETLTEEDFQRLRPAVEALRLQSGSTVVDLGCGTGLNLSLLQTAVGPDGRIIGVDLTPDRLEEAVERVRSAGWTNVEFVQADMASYRFPSDVDGVLSTLAITITPSYDDVIHRAAEALRPGGRVLRSRPASHESDVNLQHEPRTRPQRRRACPQRGRA